MSTTKHLPLTKTELRVWLAAFLAAELPVLLKGKHLTPEGAAHLAADYARAAVDEYRRAKTGEV